MQKRHLTKPNTQQYNTEEIENIREISQYDKGHLWKLTTRIILYVKRLNALFLKQGRRQRCTLSSTWGYQARETNKAIQIGKEEVNDVCLQMTCSYTQKMLSNLLKKNLLDIINGKKRNNKNKWFSKVVRYNINTQKSMYFYKLPINNPKMKLQESIYNSCKKNKITSHTFDKRQCKDYTLQMIVHCWKKEDLKKWIGR